MSYHRDQQCKQALKDIELALNVLAHAAQSIPAAKRDLIILQYDLVQIIKKCPSYGDAEKVWDQELLMRRLGE
jgi:hypothetical protein